MSSRVHGQYNIIRRCNVKEQSDYRKYRDDLREDFFHICGYCGKLEEVTKHGFEIDHFVPIKIDGSKKTKYNNLVYSCFTCNRKKVQIGQQRILILAIMELLDMWIQQIKNLISI